MQLESTKNRRVCQWIPRRSLNSWGGPGFLSGSLVSQGENRFPGSPCIRGGVPGLPESLDSWRAPDFPRGPWILGCPWVSTGSLDSWGVPGFPGNPRIPEVSLDSRGIPGFLGGPWVPSVSLDCSRVSVSPRLNAHGPPKRSQKNKFVK